MPDAVLASKRERKKSFLCLIKQAAQEPAAGLSLAFRPKSKRSPEVL